MLNFYRPFLPHAAGKQTALHGSLAGLRGAQAIPWTPELSRAFAECKEALADTTLLAHPHP